MDINNPTEPCIYSYTTLSAKHAINDKLQGSVATWTRKQTALDRVSSSDRARYLLTTLAILIANANPDLNPWPWLSVIDQLLSWPINTQQIKVKGQLVWNQTNGRTRPIAVPCPLTLSVTKSDSVLSQFGTVSECDRRVDVQNQNYWGTLGRAKQWRGVR